MPSKPFEGTSPLPTAPRLPRSEAIVAAYLDNYSARRGEGLRVFPADEMNLVVALLYLDVGNRLREPVCKAVARWEVTMATSALPSDRSDPSLNIAGFLSAAAGRDLAALDGDALIERALIHGGDAESARGVFGIAWRALLLATVDDARFAEELTQRLHYLRKKAAALAAEQDEQPLYQRSRLAFLLALVADALEDQDLRADAAGLASTVAAHQTQDGSLPTASGTARGGPASSAHIADFLLAAHATGLDEAAEAARRFLLEQRLDAAKQLLYSKGAEEAKYEFSPWVPLALARTSSRIGALAAVLNPPAAAPPDFRIVRADSDSERVSFELEVGDRQVTRSFDATDFNALLLQILEQLTEGPADALSPRLRSHVVLGLDDLAARTDDAHTLALLESEIRGSLDYVLSAQLDNGGWPFARKNIPSYIYTAGQRKEREFPDEEYSIDTAVPGLALCGGYRRFADARYLAAAEAAFGFFETTIGRVERDGYQIWRLYPGDEKTERQGTAVNYELWAGAFFASLTSLTSDDRLKARALGYIEGILEYTSKHLYETGDIAYGDYVSERRTPYASWDAFLLFEIERFTGLARAGAMARQITKRLGEVMFGSGGIPNVVPFEQQIEGHTRWLVHRHGVGPYPIRGYYQLYCVAACARGAVDADVALRALGFVLIEMYEPVFSGMSTGYFGDGRYDDRPDSLERIGRDWLLLSLGNLHAISEVDYRPDISRVPRIGDRLGNLVVRLQQDCETRWGWPPPDCEAAGEYGRGCVAMHAATGDESWLALARQCRTGMMAGDAPARLAAANLAVELDGEAGRDIALLALASVEPDLEPRALASAAELAALVEGSISSADLLAQLPLDDTTDGLVLAAIARIAAIAVPGAAGALGERLERAWTASIETKLGRGYADPRTRTLMAGDELANLSLAFVIGSRILDRAEHRERGLHLLRYLLHSYRDETGALTAARKERGLDPNTGGRMFHAIARIASETRSYAQDQWFPAGIRRRPTPD